MDDERLREHGFDEPTRPEQRLEAGARRGIRRGISRADKSGAEYEVQQQIGRDVQNRADRPEREHEPHDGAGFPYRGLLQALLLRVVPRDGGAGEVIDEVQQDKLNGQHGEEGQKRARREHGEHIAEIGRRGDLDVFHHVRVRPSPFDDAVRDDGQIFFEQDDARRFFGDVCRRIDGDAHVSRAHGGSVVDAVAHETDDVPPLAQGAHDALLLRGRKFCEHRSLLRGGGKLFVVQIFQIAAEQDAAARKPDFAADARRDLFVVARQYLDGDAERMQAGDRLRRRLFGRVEEGEITDENHVRLVFTAHRPPFRQNFLRNGEHAHPLPVQFVRAGTHRGFQFACQRAQPAADLRAGRYGEHLLHRAFGDEQRLRPVADGDAHSAALEIEGYLVRLAPSLRLRRVDLARRDKRVGALYDGDVHEIFEPRLIIAVEERALKDARVLLALHVQVQFEHHLVLRERTRLVRAEDIHRAEVLHGVHVFDDDLSARKREGAAREARRDDHGEHFGREPHGDAHGEQQRAHPVALRQPVEQEHDGHHREHKADEDVRDRIHALFEGGLFAPAAQRARRSAQKRVRTRHRDDARSAAADHVRTHKGEAAAGGRRIARRGAGVLFFGSAFTRQGGLRHEQIFRAHDAQIRGDHVARGEADFIPHSKLGHGDFAHLAAAQHGGGRAYHGSELFRRRTAARLLHEAQDARHEHHDRDDGDRHIILFSFRREYDVRKHRNQRQRAQNRRERVGERRKQAPESAALFSRGEHVRAQTFAPFLCLCGGKPALLCAEQGADFRLARRRGCAEALLRLLRAQDALRHAGEPHLSDLCHCTPPSV